MKKDYNEALKQFIDWADCNYLECWEKELAEADDIAYWNIIDSDISSFCSHPDNAPLNPKILGQMLRKYLYQFADNDIANDGNHTYWY